MKLKKLRQDHQETQLELAESLNISVSTVQKVEQGIRTASDTLKIRIAKHYGLTVGYIFFEEPITNSDNPTRERPGLKDKEASK
ncbi:helix-turn-helix transcriptional regulator [Levilactobacillus brevis]|uniref:helix-turn-helix transcriptional regulator n=1 Tax=Levilactobacillus brevis TaxID=1580 RepID=UPI0021A6D8DA|nr:helix-turn-helix transcriptional regulator [Levilactobacillus brevis]